VDGVGLAVHPVKIIKHRTAIEILRNINLLLKKVLIMDDYLPGKVPLEVNQVCQPGGWQTFCGSFVADRGSAI
jgi:hypothetical protein